MKQLRLVCSGYKEAMQGVRKKLLARTAPQGGLLFVGELHGEILEPKMDHLVCFLPGATRHSCCKRQSRYTSTGDIYVKIERNFLEFGS